LTVSAEQKFTAINGVVVSGKIACRQPGLKKEGIAYRMGCVAPCSHSFDIIHLSVNSGENKKP